MSRGDILEEIRAKIDREGFDYFFRFYTKPESYVEEGLSKHDPFLKAWKKYRDAADELENCLPDLG